MTVPIKGVAHELGLPIHHLDTFNNWTLPSPFDLIVAVSFGLLVPARIINATTYGGLNVHPSLLPDLRGAAPIQHAILGGRHYTGVSVQTMHPTKFDCGEVIAQTPLPGIRIAHETTTEDLINQLAPLGATMLRNSIDRGLFISPKTVLRKEEINPRSLEPAPKITPEDGHINWDKWTAHRILRANRALGRLWDTTTVQRCNAQSQETRVSYDGKWKLVEAQKIEAFGISDPLRAGSPVRVVSSGTDQVDIALATVDGQFVMPESITIAGQGKGKGGSHLLRLMNYM
jgi:methionyl-tRNA formyltransferase